MRVISQDGTLDVPYEMVTVQRYGTKIYYLNTNLAEGELNGLSIGNYSTKEKAIKAMEMLREAYSNNVFYHHTATIDEFKDSMRLLSNEKFKEETSEYFQFPQDDEIEV